MENYSFQNHLVSPLYRFQEPQPGSPHRPFWEHIKEGKNIWRDDKLNGIQEWLSLKDLNDDPNEIVRFGYKDLSIKGVLTHSEHGVYIGHCMGLGFWSNLDTAGQDSVPLFTEAEAVEHILSWDGDHSPSDYKVKYVAAVDPLYATFEECNASGIVLTCK